MEIKTDEGGFCNGHYIIGLCQNCNQPIAVKYELWKNNNYSYLKKLEDITGCCDEPFYLWCNGTGTKELIIID